MAHWLLSDERTRDRVRCDTVDDGGWSPLMSAAAVGDVTLVAALLGTAARTQLHAQNSSGNTALHYAAGKKHMKVCALLLDAANPTSSSAASTTGSNTSDRSTTGGSATASSLVEVRNRYGESALHRAAAAGSLAGVQLLAPLMVSGPLSAHLYRGHNSLLHLAAQAGGHEGIACARYLLEADRRLADVYNAEKQRPADVAASKGICKLIESFEQHQQTEVAPGECDTLATGGGGGGGAASTSPTDQGDAPVYI
jgi:Ankyrin repeats (3 copies)